MVLWEYIAYLIRQGYHLPDVFCVFDPRMVAWEATALPLGYTRMVLNILTWTTCFQCI